MLALPADYRSARAVTRRHARGFYLAAHLLSGPRRRAAFALYAFCRRLDELVDGGGPSRVGSPGWQQRLAQARRQVSQLYLRLPALAAPAPLDRQLAPGERSELPWPPEELAALEDTLARFQLPEQPFQDFLSGREMDLAGQQYPDFATLDLYCHRVAGVVGLLATVLGCEDPAALTELGKAMQLTRILRDVREDLARGRRYLPATELAHHGLADADLHAHHVDARWRGFMRFQVSRARALYSRAARGIRALHGFGAQRMVWLIGGLRAGLLEEIEAREYDVFTTRARVSAWGKLRGLALVLVRPEALLPAVVEAEPVVGPGAFAAVPPLALSPAPAPAPAASRSVAVVRAGEDGSLARMGGG